MQWYILDKRKSGSDAINDICNALLLQADLHFYFDFLKFVFIPKGRKKDDDRLVFVSHIITPSTKLIKLYYNTALGHLKDIAREFLLVRFV
jgi:hypothetical protein